MHHLLHSRLNGRNNKTETQDKRAGNWRSGATEANHLPSGVSPVQQL